MSAYPDTSRLVTIFGGSGFVGRHVVRALARRGYRIRVACRRPDLAGHLQPMGMVGQIQVVQANLRARWSVERAVEGADIVINLVGILHQGGAQRFTTIHDEGARIVAEAARAVGARLIHMSAIGASPDSPSLYAQSKAAGEAAVFKTVPEAIVFRPSVIFGAGDGFYSRFAQMARFSPVLPLIGGGKTRFQPVYVLDVAEAFARAVDGEARPGMVYELGGPSVSTFRECMEEMLGVIGRRRLLVPVPFFLASMIGAVAQYLPGPLLTADQVRQLRSDNVVSAEAEAEGRTLAGLGIEPEAASGILPGYLWTYRRAGQYSSNLFA